MSKKPVDSTPISKSNASFRETERRHIVIARSLAAERAVRSAAHGLGLRYRLLDEQMPGRPHLVFPARKAVIFVCDCAPYAFHHDCPDRHLGSELRSFAVSGEYHRRRLEQMSNVLERRGWRVLHIYECETKDREKLASRINAFVQGTNPRARKPAEP